MTPRQNASPSPETQEISSSSTASACHRPAKGKHRFCLRFLPCPLPSTSRFKHSPDFSGIQSESVPALRPTARPHIRRQHACHSYPYRNALSPSPFFRKKPRISCPANLLENDFPPGYLFCQPLYKREFADYLTHNHRRRCGNDFIADARSALPQIFCQIFNR